MIVRKINEQSISKRDLIIHMGDLALTCRYEDMINTIKSFNAGTIAFITGNHDQRVERMFTSWDIYSNNSDSGRVMPIERELFKSKKLIRLYKMEDIEIKEYPKDDISKKAIRTSITLNHFPMEIWDKMNRGAYHLCGHSHGNFARTGLYYTGAGKRVDCGVENALAYSNGENVMFTLKDIHDIMRDKPIVKVDHH
jgi:calcineurin-like phosphoesterase family protein